MKKRMEGIRRKQKGEKKEKGKERDHEDVFEEKNWNLQKRGGVGGMTVRSSGSRHEKELKERGRPRLRIRLHHLGALERFAQ